MRLSPEILLAGADVVQLTEGRIATPQGPGGRDPAGVEEQGTLTGVPQEPGRPRCLHGKSRPELPGDQLQASAAHSPPGERTQASATKVPPSEGNEAWRDGRQEVVAL